MRTVKCRPGDSTSGRSRPGANLAVGVAHGRCNGEEGRNWDRKRRKPAGEYDAFIARLHARRLERWRGAPPA